jgi:hypothetical protein
MEEKGGAQTMNQPFGMFVTAERTSMFTQRRKGAKKPQKRGSALRLCVKYLLQAA